MKIGSLFTGYGGLDLATQAIVGGTVVWHSDIKPAAVALLAHRHPELPNHGDITTLDPSTVTPVDVLTFGWPCQPHSAAGKRLGEADPRALWPHVHRIVEHLRPTYLLGENVARVVSNAELRRVVRTLAALGYVGAYRTVRASDIGAPHRRDRLFLLAAHAGSRRAAGPDALTGGGTSPAGLGPAEPGGLGGGAPAGLTLLPTPLTSDTRGRWTNKDDRSSTTGRPLREVVHDLPARLLPTPEEKLARSGPDYARMARPESGGDDLTTAVARLALLPTPSASNYGTNQGGAAGRVGPVRESLDTMARNGRFDPTLLPTPKESDGPKGGPGMRGSSGDLSMPSVATTVTANGGAWGIFADAVARWEPIVGRPAPEPTMIGARTGRPQLAPVFVEWMMGLPRGWVTDVPGLTRNQQLSLLGDGVVPLQAATAYAELLTLAVVA